MSAVGALSLLSLFKDALALKQALRTLVEAWHQVVHPIASYVFQWVPALWALLPFNIPLPAWYPEYLTIGVVVTSAIVRGVSVAGQRVRRYNDANEKVRNYLTELKYEVGRESPASMSETLQANWRARDAWLREETDDFNSKRARGFSDDEWASLFEEFKRASDDERAARDKDYPIVGANAVTEFLNKHYPAASWSALVIGLVTAVLFPIWPLTWIVVLLMLAGNLNLFLTKRDLWRYALTSLQFLIYFSAFVGVNYILFWLP